MASSPIFVVGTPRSGTSLVAEILGRHSALFVPGEAHFFSAIYSRRNEIGELCERSSREEAVRLLLSLYERFNQPEDQKRISVLEQSNIGFTEKLASCKSYEELFSTFMQMQAEREGKERWGNKVPKDIFHVDDILSFYPDAKIIVCVRDIRAFLLSYRGKWKITSQSHTERLKKLYHPIVTSLLWKSSMRLVPKIRETVSSKNVMIVPYEGLVENPREVVPAICEMVGENYEPAMLDVTSNNSSHGVSTSGIYSVSVTKWKAELSAEEIWICQKVARNELEYLKYDVQPVTPNFFKLAKTILGTPAAVFRALSANKESRGPIIPYVAKRILSLVSGSPIK